MQGDPYMAATHPLDSKHLAIKGLAQIGPGNPVANLQLRLVMPPDGFRC